MEKLSLLNKINADYTNVYNNEEIVLGSGSADARVILIGEAPGKDEVLLGKPFVGAAGKYLQNFLDILQLKREDIYITNAIKYRLFKINQKTGRKVNRPATKSEILGSRPYLHSEINIINPSIIVTLGNVPLESVLGKASYKIGEVHGKELGYNSIENNHILFPLYHPASIIYNRSLVSVYENDLMILKNVLNLRKVK